MVRAGALISMERSIENVLGSTRPTSTIASAAAPTNASVHWMIFTRASIGRSSGFRLVFPTMCSRYFLDAEGNVIAFTFRVPMTEGIGRRYNIAPTQQAPVVRAAASGAREAAMLRWGLVPPWAKDIAVGNRMINARAEGIEAKPAFREAVKSRRCLVPATGFYEWKGIAGRKQPYAIRAADRPVFAFAGLWERWHGRGGEALDTFAIVTTEAAPAVAAIHDRMPVIVAPREEDAWLAAPVDEALALLKPYAGPINVRAVSRLVSDPRNEAPECLNDAEPTWDQQSLL